jgi:copper(I)-binding protein
MRCFSGLIAVAMLAGCQQPAETKVDGAWVRLPAAAERPGAAYFTIQGGSTADTLLSVTTPAALRTELHESIKGDKGMMSMKPIADIAIPAGAKIAFAPGGKHVMLFSIGPNVKPGDRLPLALAFASGKRIEVQAQARAPGDLAPE